MVNGIYAIFLVTAYILQTTLINRITFFGAAPDLILAVLIACSINSSMEKSVVIGLVTGILTDMLSGGSFGVQTAVYTYSAVAAGLLGINILGKNAVTAVFVTAIVSISAGLIKAVIMYVTNVDRSFWFMLTRMSLLFAVYNCIIVFFIYVLIDSITSNSYRRRR